MGNVLGDRRRTLSAVGIKQMIKVRHAARKCSTDNEYLKSKKNKNCALKKWRDIRIFKFKYNLIIYNLFISFSNIQYKYKY